MRGTKTLVDIALVYFKGQLCDNDTVSHIADIDVCEPLSYDVESESLNSLYQVKKSAPPGSNLKEFLRLTIIAK